MSYTPGPWGTKRAGKGPDRDVGITAPGCAGVIAECFEEFRARGDRHWHPGEAEANARLIAAAPELLTGLLHVRHSDHGYWPSACSGCEAAEKAIAKAQGR